MAERLAGALVTTFSAGSVTASSFSGGSVSELLNDSFDMVLVCSSWDERCLAATEVSSLQTSEALILEFNQKDKHGLRAKHDQKLQRFFRRRAPTSVVEGDVRNLRDTWRQLQVSLGQVANARGGGLRLLLDITTMPRFYSLAVLGAGLKSGAIAELSLLYSEGSYPDPPARGDVAFTRGIWKATPIPTFEGEYDPGKGTFYLVSIGFEGGKTLRVVRRADPTRVVALLPDPGTHPDYAARTRADNRILLEEFVDPAEGLIRAPAGDAVAAWRALSETGAERPEIENSFFLCSGTKAHSVALALRALHLEFPALLYNLPERHEVVNVRPSGVYWRYDLISRSTPI